MDARLHTLLAAALLVLAQTGCALLPGGESEPVPRECRTLSEAELPPLEETLDPTEIVAALRARPAEQDEVRLTVSVREDGDEIRIFSADPENGASLGAWPVLVRDALRSPLPDAAFPGVRVRLVPGPEGRAELEPVTLCPPLLRNEDELRERYRAQMSDVAQPPMVEAAFELSDLGGIRTLQLSMPDGADDLELLARRALHFARFEPALLDGRRIPYTVRMRFPPDA